MTEQARNRSTATWRAVKEMYEAYPFPSPIVGDSLISDVAYGLYSICGERQLEGSRILDAGCGTGHRLVGTARRYPGAQFVGLDMCEKSLAVARSLASKHDVTNVHLEQGNLLDLHLTGDFDFIISNGVIHHLEDPERGLRNLAARLAPNGLLMIWLYHSVGEHERLMGRELLHLMWDRESGLQPGVQMMRDLDLQLEVTRYGSSPGQKATELSRLHIDVDAYVHPIVNAYTAAETLAMFRRCPGIDWAAINSINLIDDSKLIDLAEAETAQMRYFCQSVESLFEKETLRTRFRELGAMEKLRVMELKLKPTGFTVVAGRQQTYRQLGPRLIGNTVELAA